MLAALLSVITLTVPALHAEQHATHHWYNQRTLLLLASVPTDKCLVLSYPLMNLTH
jgi:hypothetical protein